MKNISKTVAFLSVILGTLWSGTVAMAQDDNETWPSKYATVNGIKIHYVAVGKGQTILFLHGFPEFWYEWREQLKAFGKEYQAVAMDMRGYNLSEKPAKVEDYAIPNLVADVKAMLDKVSKGKKAILVAHDWGGVVAWAYAAAHPETLEKLIINAPHPTVFSRELQNNPAQQRASAYMNFFRSPTAEVTLSANNYGFLANAVLKGSSRPNTFSEADIKEYIKAWSQPGALTGGLNYYRAARIGPPAKPGSGAPSEESALNQLPPLMIKVPTLVIWGEKDTALLVGSLDGLDKFVPDLKVQRIPDGTHWVLHEQPEKVNTFIREFLQGKM